MRAGARMAAAASALVACNALSGLDADYVLDEGAALPSEAGTDGRGDGAADATASDGGSIDGGPVTADADAGATWCPASAAWCEDWDERTAPWDREEIVGGFSTVEAGQGVGNSKALHVQVNNVALSRKVARWRNVASSFPVGTRTWLTFSFRLANVGIDYAVIGALSANNTTTTNTEYGLAAYKGCPGACLDENNPAQEGAHPFVGQTPYVVGQWHRAEVVVERSAAGYAGTVKVDGKVVDDKGATYFGSPQEPSVVDVGVGLFFTGNDLGTADVYIDDIAAGQGS